MISGLARLATEEAVSRPALPMSFVPGISGMQMSKAYFEKLKDPRWQKKRLEALEASFWKCACCGDAQSTLHVHHRQYFKGREPWEYEVGQLEVLCESCHAIEHEADADPLLVATSYVSSTGPQCRDVVASLVAGFCHHPMDASHVGDPTTYLAGDVAVFLERHGFAADLSELCHVLRLRDKWTIRAAISSFLDDLKSRPDETPPPHNPARDL